MAVKLTSILDRAISDRGKDSNDKISIGILLGRFKETPFKTIADEVRVSLEKMLKEDGFERDVEHPGDQAIDYGLMALVGDWVKDPDFQIARECLQGVKIGYREPLPRTPAVWPQKDKWKLHDDSELDPSSLNSNYISAKDKPEVLISKFIEQQDLGFMSKTLYGLAKAQYGDRLRVASMALVQEGDDYRVIHDGSNKVLVNHGIKIPDHELYPSPADVAAAVDQDGRTLPTPVKSYLSLKSDVSKAHRRVPVHPSDWGLQACAIQPMPEVSYLDDWEIFLNCVGTYGIGSASWFWGRVGALLIRFVFYFTRMRWAFRFADDFKFLNGIVKSGDSLVPFLEVMILFEVFKVPIKWSKTSGGTTLEWIGFFFDYTKLEHGLSISRATWLANWASTAAKDGIVVLRDLKGFIGRLGFGSSVLDHLKPFLAPLYAWSSIGDDSCARSLPLAIRLVLLWISKQVLAKRVVNMRPIVLKRGEKFRADAKAEGMEVVLGGWEVTSGSDIPTPSSRWYAVRLNPSNAPWAFCKGQPYKTIAALELFATLLCVIAFGSPPGGITSMAHTVAFTGVTDNQGNQGAHRKNLSTRYPLCLILMELSSQLQARGERLDLVWRRRDENVEADALTNDDYSAFNLAMRVELDIPALPWIVLPWLTSEAGRLYHDIAQSKATAQQAVQNRPNFTTPKKKRRRETLRQSDPW